MFLPVTLEEVEVEWDALDKVEPPFTAEDAAGGFGAGDDAPPMLAAV